MSNIEFNNSKAQIVTDKVKEMFAPDEIDYTYNFVVTHYTEDREPLVW